MMVLGRELCAHERSFLNVNEGLSRRMRLVESVPSTGLVFFACELQTGTITILSAKYNSASPCIYHTKG